MLRPTLRSPLHAVTSLLLASAVGLLAPPPLAGQDAGEVIDRALERYRDRMEGIQDYSVTQEVMGVRTTTYFEKEEVDGEPVFRVVETGRGSGAAPDEALVNPFAVLREIRDRARLEGSSTVDGHRTHRIRIEDFEGTALRELGLTGDRGRFEPREGTVFVDAEEYVPRRIDLRGRVSPGEGSGAEGEPRPVSLVAHLRDYRTVEGMLYPFRVDVEAEGMQHVLSDRERRQIQSFQERLDAMPEQQRRMMEQMMGPDMQRLRKMLETGDLDLSMEVSELRVNEGPPGDGEGGGGS